MPDASHLENLEVYDETKEIAEGYVLENEYGSDSDDEELDTIQDLRIRTSLFSIAEPSNTLMSSPVTQTQIQTQQQGDNLQSPSKRRKTNDTAASYGLDKFSLPSISPHLSWPELRATPTSAPIVSSTGFTPNFDFGNLLGPSPPVLRPEYHVPEGCPERPCSAPGHSHHDSLSGVVGELALGVGDYLSPRLWNQVSVWSNPSLLEACLMRYFVEELARWFDLCDPERHFALVVPQRARSCPPLLNAIFTASARHLARLEKWRTPYGIRACGKILPDLKIETAIHYHNECINHLIQLSQDPEQLKDENLLAAAVILRFYEEVDAPLRGSTDSDSEVFLHVMKMFIDAQIPESPTLPHSSPLVSFSGPSGAAAGPTNTSITSASPASSSGAPPSSTTHTHPLNPPKDRQSGLRQAAFWVAFRQEIYNAFNKQKPFAYSLERCEAFRSFEPAEDAVWADRMVVFCADVIAFCHNDTSGSGNARDRWNELKALEKRWTESLPLTFQPIYQKPAGATRHNDNGDGDATSKSNPFPELWYLADCHVAGVQHIELARIMLAVYNPHIPRMGPGHLLALKALSTDLRAIVRRLCGIALSNRISPPGLVTACMGIAQCGEHFVGDPGDDEVRREQESLLKVLDEMEREHAWPSRRTREGLKRAWGWEGSDDLRGTDGQSGMGDALLA